jgi:hypothetical protein
MTEEQMLTQINDTTDVVVNTLSTIDGTTFDRPIVTNLSAVSIVNVFNQTEIQKQENYQIRTTTDFNSVPSVTVLTNTPVTFTERQVNDVISNESININISTLVDSVNSANEVLRTEVVNRINTAIGDINNTLNDIQTRFNTVQNKVVSDLTTQITNNDQAALNSFRDHINGLVTAINTGNEAQNNSFALNINNLSTELFTNLVLLKNKANELQTKISYVDEIFTAESTNSGNIDTLNTYLNQLAQTDIDIVQAVNYLMSENKSQMVVQTYKTTVTTVSGEFTVNYRDNARWGEFVSASDVFIFAQSANKNVRIYKLNQTREEVTYQILTDGVHYQPQPRNCSGALTYVNQTSGDLREQSGPVSVTLFAVHARRNFSAMDISLFDQAYVANNEIDASAPIDPNNIVITYTGAGPLLASSVVSINSSSVIEIPILYTRGLVRIFECGSNTVVGGAGVTIDNTTRVITISGSVLGVGEHTIVFADDDSPADSSSSYDSEKLAMVTVIVVA